MISFANKFAVTQQILQVVMLTKPEAKHFSFISQATTGSTLTFLLSDRKNNLQNTDLHQALNREGSDMEKGWSTYKGQDVSTGGCQSTDYSEATRSVHVAAQETHAGDKQNSASFRLFI